MKLKNFLQENPQVSFEIIPNILILNVIVGSVTYGLDVDTNNIQNGTRLETVSEYTLENDILTVSGLSVNTNDVDVLESELIN
jgi:hypothetical protein